jgi:hypothetical protein
VQDGPKALDDSAVRKLEDINKAILRVIADLDKFGRPLLCTSIHAPILRALHATICILSNVLNGVAKIIAKKMSDDGSIMSIDLVAPSNIDLEFKKIMDKHQENKAGLYRPDLL